MDKKKQIEEILRRELSIGKRVTEDKIQKAKKDLIESVDWSDAKDVRPDTDRSVDWGDAKDS